MTSLSMIDDCWCLNVHWQIFHECSRRGKLLVRTILSSCNRENSGRRSQKCGLQLENEDILNMTKHLACNRTPSDPSSVTRVFNVQGSCLRSPQEALVSTFPSWLDVAAYIPHSQTDTQLFARAFTAGLRHTPHSDRIRSGTIFLYSTISVV